VSTHLVVSTVGSPEGVSQSTIFSARTYLLKGCPPIILRLLIAEITLSATSEGAIASPQSSVQSATQPPSIVNYSICTA